MAHEKAVRPKIIDAFGGGGGRGGKRGKMVQNRGVSYQLILAMHVMLNWAFRQAPQRGQILPFKHF